MACLSKPPLHVASVCLLTTQYFIIAAVIMRQIIQVYGFDQISALATHSHAPAFPTLLSILRVLLTLSAI